MTQRITVTVEDSGELEVLHDGEITLIRRRVDLRPDRPGLVARKPCIDTEGAEVIDLDERRGKGEQ